MEGRGLVNRHPEFANVMHVGTLIFIFLLVFGMVQSLHKREHTSTRYDGVLPFGRGGFFCRISTFAPISPAVSSVRRISLGDIGHGCLVQVVLDASALPARSLVTC